MTPKILVAAFALVLGPAAALAQAVLSVDPNEIYFQFTPSPNFVPPGAKVFPNSGVARLCGFSILANHHSRSNPKVEWDLNR